MKGCPLALEPTAVREFNEVTLTGSGKTRLWAEKWRIRNMESRAIWLVALWASACTFNREIETGSASKININPLRSTALRQIFSFNAYSFITPLKPSICCLFFAAYTDTVISKTSFCYPNFPTIWEAVTFWESNSVFLLKHSRCCWDP